MNRKKWIWQHEDFPNFNYDYERIEPLIYRLVEKSGELKGRIAYLDVGAKENFSIETSIEEIVSNSKIEGVELQRDSVRSSLRKKFDIAFNRAEDKSTKTTDALTELYVDSRFNQEPLSLERLHRWHSQIFKDYNSIFYPVKKGVFRSYDDMQIVSGTISHEKVHYEAIPPKDIAKNIDELLDYINYAKTNFAVKSAIAHLWFESIHPYDDGNGRIGRAITNYILAKDGGLDNRYYSISSAINQDKEGYYEAFEEVQNLDKNSHLEVTNWIIWHTRSIEKSIEFSIENIQKVVKKTKFFDKMKSLKLNEKQRKVINRLLDVGEGNFEGGLTNKKYRGLTKTNSVTASRHLKDMLDKGIIREIEGFSGRNIRYELDFGIKKEEK